MTIDLRLKYFMPGIRIPSEANVHLALGIQFLLAAFYTLTITSRPRTVATVRLWLGLAAASIFYHCTFHPYGAPTRGTDTAIATVGLYGIMRVIDVCLVDLFVGTNAPPRWVVNGKGLPLPTSFRERLAYALDYLTTLQGTSMFKNTTWDWMSPSLSRRLTPPGTSRGTFIRNSLVSLFKNYLVYDTLDAFNKHRVWDCSQLHPITNGGLSVPEQLLAAFSVCVTTSLSISISAIIVSIFSVACGAAVEAWPPIFDRPFSAVSLEDFWTRRWHSLFRRTFDRLSLGILGAVERITGPLPPRFRKLLRVATIFGLSALLHLLLMHRLPTSETHQHPAFFDRSILVFFMSQPLHQEKCFRIS
ncbi:membrane bound O-acyl transferase family protein [Rhizoctonia solani AG-3 Rhs1AP]|uniref:Membrane bound O-acyl transferase family protein n=2 Tax=Rhizoctonia solani AG-3 TaxID=1086053 RepID=A0A074S405_9AGAM|nr:membrane bound O-acyl transferase family protein [Rhizoctonia solani AG-3 Rhs1AP]KEP52250.1 membrane bound O-acyl transferase family protein [Rhizoctonia solani 123E]